MRTAYIKPNSYTQQETTMLLLAKKEVLKYARMLPSEHNDLMFEYGCRFVENCIPDRHFRLAILTDTVLGFWQWWRYRWAKDDAGLLQQESFDDLVSYPKMKASMITDAFLRKDFKNLLMYY